MIDGGLATELDRRGSDLSGPLWSAHALLEQPALVEDAHAAYLAAGADCLITSHVEKAGALLARGVRRTGEMLADLAGAPLANKAGLPTVPGCTSGQVQDIHRKVV